MFYCSLAPRPTTPAMVRRLAHYVFDNDTWLGAGHTMETHDIELLQSRIRAVPAFLPDARHSRRLPADETRGRWRPCDASLGIPITAEELPCPESDWFLQAPCRRFNKNVSPYVFEPGQTVRGSSSQDSCRRSFPPRMWKEPCPHHAPSRDDSRSGFGWGAGPRSSHRPCCDAYGSAVAPARCRVCLRALRSIRRHRSVRSAGGNIRWPARLREHPSSSSDGASSVSLS